MSDPKPRIIKEIKVNDTQLKYLQQYKEQQFALKKEIHSDIFPALVDGIKQTRELTQNISLIAGAIASFTIPVLNTSTIQYKPLAYLSLSCLFATICYAIYHLSEIIPKEVNELARQHSTYNDVVDESINRINEVIESGEIDKLVQVDEQDILSRLNALETKPSVDKSLNRLRTLLFLALGFLALSFLPLEQLILQFKN